MPSAQDVVCGFLMRGARVGALNCLVGTGYAMMIVRHDPDSNVWIIDEDSRHHLEKGHDDVFELQVVSLRPLVRDVGVDGTLFETQEEESEIL